MELHELLRLELQLLHLLLLLLHRELLRLPERHRVVAHLRGARRHHGGGAGASPPPPAQRADAARVENQAVETKQRGLQQGLPWP